VTDFWKYSCQELEKISARKPYIRRLRLKYAILLNSNLTFTGRLKDASIRILALFNLIKNLFYYQVFKPFIPSEKIFILISNNPVYIHTILPLVIALNVKGIKFHLLAPSNQLKTLRSKLRLNDNIELIPIEALQVHPNSIIKIRSILKALVLTFRDLFWFANKPLRHSKFFAPALARFSVTEYFFNPHLINTFTSDSTLIAANDHWMWESLFFIAAKNKTAKTYVLQHGVIGNLSYPLFANKFLVWGQADANKMIQTFGALPNEIEIAGSPHFDEVIQRMKAFKTSESQHYQPFLTFLSQPFLNSGNIKNQIYEEVVKMFGSLQNIAKSLNKEIVIKLHPADNIEIYERLLPGVKILNQTLFEVLSQSSLCLTFDSTALFESAFFEIPVIQIIPENSDRIIDFSETGLTDLATNKNQLAEVVTKIFSLTENYNARVRKELETLNYYYSFLGHSVERIITLFYQKIN
jgi:hypothetical protein